MTFQRDSWTTFCVTHERGILKIFLTGFMASGKSAVGRRISRSLKIEFLDLDRDVEHRAGRRIAQIFEESGEAEFRRLESEALDRAAAAGPLIVATGGGAVGSEENRRLMKDSGVVVWLDAELETILGRLRRGPPGRRPLAGSDADLASLLRSRADAYRDCHLRIQVRPDDSIGVVADHVLEGLRSRECVT